MSAPRASVPADPDAVASEPEGAPAAALPPCGEEALPSELPEVLAHPPWRDPKQRPPRRRVLRLEPLERDDGPLQPPYDVRSPRLAPFMARALAGRAARAEAEAWLCAFPEAAAVGLVPDALGPAGPAQRDAERALRRLAARGHADEVRAVAARHGPDAADAVDALLGADPRLRFPARLPAPAPFWSAAELPPPLLREGARRLPLGAIEEIGVMLAFSPADEPYVGLDDVRRACDPASLERFASAIFERWLAAGAPSKHAWALHALGVFGGDETARRLAPLIRDWPSQGARARASHGIRVLARIGSDLAILHLSAIAARSRHPSLAERAREELADLASARGTSAEELADRAPDLGLDAAGARTFDFGARAFRVELDAELKPIVFDAAGKRLADLPKPGKSDDAVRAPAAVAAFRALRADARVLAATHLQRLESAMCHRRRWSAGSFRARFVEHPVLVQAARRLVWAVYEDGRLASTFRIAEDRTLAGPDDEPVQLAAEAVIGLPHALELDAAALARWGEVLSDYAIAQPLRQLGREVYAPSAEERSRRAVGRFRQIEVPTVRLFALDTRGWRRAGVDASGLSRAFMKQLDADVFAVLELDPGIAPGAPMVVPTQTLGDLSLVREDGRPGPRFGEIDPVSFSELLRDVELAVR